MVGGMPKPENAIKVDARYRYSGKSIEDRSVEATDLL